MEEKIIECHVLQVDAYKATQHNFQALFHEFRVLLLGN